MRRLLRHWRRWWDADRGEEAVILMYHRVTELESDPWGLAVTPQHFTEHLEVLAAMRTPVRLDAYLRARAEGKPPRRAVIVTFDDGYADNLLTAKPLLEAAGVPATMFVTAGYVDEDRELWSDELDRLLLQPGRLPQTLELTLEGRERTWNLGGAADYTAEAARTHRGWRMWHATTPTPRQQAYRELWHLLQPLCEADRQKTLDVLRLWAGTNRSGRPTHRIMTTVEVQRLGTGDLIEVGSHTVTHPKLAALPWAVQRQEIRQSKQRLQEIVGREVSTFAYPYGSPSAYTPETVALVEEAGYEGACVTSQGLVNRATPCRELPRIRVNDWDGEGFARKLAQAIREGHT